MSEARDRGGAKWDRAARYFKIARILAGHPDGIRAQELADQVGVSKRTVYRDLLAMDADAGLPIWQEGGRWGLERDAFLQPLALTLHEATTLYLAARMLAKASDEHDSELIGAFVKLASILPPVLAEHVHATVSAFAETPRNELFTRVFRVLAEAWANRRVVELEYDSAVYDATRTVRQVRVQPWALEPSALTHALYLIGWDEERQARRTFKVERIRRASMTTATFEPGAAATQARDLLRAWDVITDEEPVAVTIRFAPAVARRAAETRWHPSQELEAEPDGSLLWRGRVAGLREIRVWILGWGGEAEVLTPLELRQSVADELARAADNYRRPIG